MVKLAPSILSADFSNLLKDVRAVEEAGVEWLHVDVMDGHFVPNISFGAPVLAALKGKTDLFRDVHLMIERPEQYIDAFVAAGAHSITVHIEAGVHIHKTLQYIRDQGVRVGLSLNPGTPLSSVMHLLPMVDLILVMSVNPGFGGQAFIPESLDRIRALREVIDANGWACDIEVDGGIKADNVKAVVDAGATVIVAGSAIFGSASIQEAVDAFRRACL